MACTSCSSGGCSTDTLVSGCGGGCKSGSCNKMNSYDWLSNMELPTDQKFDVVEVRFKNGFKAFFRNTQKFDLLTGDAVVVDATSGYHIGKVALQGELVRLQMLKKKVDENAELPAILRIPTEKDLAKWKEAQAREMPTMFRTRQIIQEMGLEMKLTDVEFQADNTKATFYYSAESRVDFRELIKVLASEFKIRVEMRQISLREEAGRLGGIGVCGRELCCSTWLTDFKSVNTSAARYQNLSLNPAKLSGQCGRLKCCLNYELETYMEALKDFPTIEKPLKTQQGIVELKKTDIFRKMMWFGYENDSNWYSLSVEKVREFIEMNEKGIFPETLAQLTEEGNNAQEQKKQALEQSKMVTQALEQKLKAKEKQEKSEKNKQTHHKKHRYKRKPKN
ncbi:PSP1 domain-containing protein [Raineya orbicola]|uniref:PSP1 C-terminal conserved region n=1 Tax=Raineya orbicola TaxID=2016530 RepID=A0A2N3I711_9BACT|nr:regulatory iron-sulfur-containing complex subunit RicT [Raineya orbicola]PKQ66023.1 PSP1 C-terminal conserved region [Raineya orbicola]